jgi:uncharacterized ferredoxin-like protein
LTLQGLKIVAQLMAVSARTAPKTMGADWIITKIATTKERSDISKTMQALGRTKEKAIFKNQ